MNSERETERGAFKANSAAAFERHNGPGIKIRLYGDTGHQLSLIDRDTARSLRDQLNSLLGEGQR